MTYKLRISLPKGYQLAIEKILADPRYQENPDPRPDAPRPTTTGFIREAVWEHIRRSGLPLGPILVDGEYEYGPVPEDQDVVQERRREQDAAYLWRVREEIRRREGMPSAADRGEDPPPAGGTLVTERRAVSDVAAAYSHFDALVPGDEATKRRVGKAMRSAWPPRSGTKSRRAGTDTTEGVDTTGAVSETDTAASDTANAVSGSDTTSED